MTSRVCFYIFNISQQHSLTGILVWTVWEQEAEKHRKQGVQAELDRRRDAEAMRQEIKGSIK